jgi:hypothetical protein
LPRHVVPVVALEQRAHRQEVFDRDPGLPRIRVLEGLAVGEIGKNGRLDSGNHSAVDRDPDQGSGDRLRARARVVERGRVRAVEVGLVDDLAVARDEDAGDLLEVAVADCGVRGVEVAGGRRSADSSSEHEGEEHR